MEQIDIFAIGELLIDFVQKSENEIGYPILSAYPGGAPCNFLAVHALYGHRCELLSCVGDDELGKKLLNTLESLKIGDKYVQVDKNHFTSLAFVTLDNTGNRSFSFFRKPGADTQIVFNERILDAIKNTRVLHYGSLSFTNEPSLSTNKKIVEFALANNIWVNYDPNYRALLWNDKGSSISAIKWGLEHTNSVKISDEEVELIYGKCDDNAYNELLKLPLLKYAFVTRGKDLVTIISKEKIVNVSAFTLSNTIDTTGAGDIFGGAVIYHLMKNSKDFKNPDIDELIMSVKFANAAAALSTTKHGGITSIPNIEEVFRLLDKSI